MSNERSSTTRKEKNKKVARIVVDDDDNDVEENINIYILESAWQRAILCEYLLRSLAGKLKYTRKITSHSQIEIWESTRYNKIHFSRLNYMELHGLCVVRNFSIVREPAFQYLNNMLCVLCCWVVLCCFAAARCCQFQWNFGLDMFLLLRFRLFHSFSIKLQIYGEKNWCCLVSHR